MTHASTTTAQARPDTAAAAGNGTADAVRFLETIFTPGDTLLLRPIEAWIEGGKKKSRNDYRGTRYELHGLKNGEGSWHPTPTRLERVLQQVAERSALERTNSFYGVCPRLGGSGRYDQAWQIRTVRTLWADIDDCTVDQAVKRIEAAGLPQASILVASGNGCHVYWLLDVAYIIDDCPAPAPVLTEWIDQGDGKKKKRRSYIIDPDDKSGKARLYLDKPSNVPALSAKAQAVQDMLAGIAAKIGGDHTKDLSRLLRIPGPAFPNRKDQRNGKELKPCILVECDPSRRYPIDTFSQYAEASPDRARREKSAQIKLPPVKKLSGKRADKLVDLVNACAVTDVGQRSDADWYLLCWSIEHGIDQAEVWARVQDVGKYRERDQAYFNREWLKAAGHTREKIFEKARGKANRKAANKKADQDKPEKPSIANAEIVDMGDGQRQTTPLTMTEVVQRIIDNTDNWPRRVEKSLFIHEGETISVSWLDSPSSLFGWLGRKCGTIRWSKVLGCVTKEETYSELCRTATAYATVEQLPHEPMIDGHYYACGAIEPGDGSALKRFLEFFAFETSLDRQLYVAGMATPLWGGLPGTRPAVMLTAPTGRGKGKSTAAKMVCRLYGGSVDVSANEDIGVIKQRFLTAEAAHLRIGFLDNLKTTRFSWGELEAFITAAQISGKRLYVGNASRPNYVTWFITLNGASLSTDMAQRVVEVRLASPNYTKSWEETVSRFVAEKQLAIIADLVALLRRPAHDLKQVSRWGVWDGHVLAHVADNPNECQTLILERRGQVDVEVEESEVIGDYFAHQLHALAYDPERDDVFIPNEVAARWYVAATGDRCKVTGAGRVLRQLHAEGRLPSIMEARGAGTLRERGFRWIGHHADSTAETQYDLRKRLAEQAESRQSKDG